MREARDKDLHPGAKEGMHLEHRGIRPIGEGRTYVIAKKDLPILSGQNNYFTPVTCQDLEMAIGIEVVDTRDPVRSEWVSAPSEFARGIDTLNAASIGHKNVTGAIPNSQDLLESTTNGVGGLQL